MHAVDAHHPFVLRAIAIARVFSQGIKAGFYRGYCAKDPWIDVMVPSCVIEAVGPCGTGKDAGKNDGGKCERPRRL